MTDPDQPAVTTLQIDAHQARLAECRRGNRDRLIAALAPYGVATATIEFDGCGDEGQVGSVDLHNDDEQTVGMPAITVEWLSFSSVADHPVPSVQTLQQALEDFAYDALCEFHVGWQDNDGAYGTVTLDIKSQTATLDFNARYTASENFTHNL